MDLQNGARQEENDYEAFNPPSKPRSLQPRNSTDTSEKTSSRSRRSLSQKRYQLRIKIINFNHQTSKMIIFIKQKKSIKKEDNFQEEKHLQT
jgi:hypothetical protein